MRNDRGTPKTSAAPGSSGGSILLPGSRTPSPVRLKSDSIPLPKSGSAAVRAPPTRPLAAEFGISKACVLSYRLGKKWKTTGELFVREGYELSYLWDRLAYPLELTTKAILVKLWTVLFPSNPLCLYHCSLFTKARGSRAKG